MSQATTRIRVHLGIHACQGAHSKRGIGRLVRDLAENLLKSHRQLIAGLHFDPNLPTSPLINDFAGYGLLRGLPTGNGSRVSNYSERDIFHVMSPVQLDIPLRRLIPPEFFQTGAPLVATLYDLIPLIYADAYLTNSVLRQKYLSRLKLYQEAEQIIAISESTRNDAVRLLGVDPDRIAVVYPGVSNAFHPADLPKALVRQRLMKHIPEIRDNYVMYLGGIDHRKNMHGAIEAFAHLPHHLRETHQFVLVCYMRPEDEMHLMDFGRNLGVADRLVLTGYIADDLLIELYQACELFVFPSLYEGFGLPVVEAMKCGAPAVVGDQGSTREIVQIERARFDPSNPRDIARVIEDALTDAAFRQELIDYGIARAERFNWQKAVEETVECYQEVASRRNRSARLVERRRRIAFLTPYPPEKSGIATYSQRVMETLSDRYPVEVDVVVQNAPSMYDTPTKRTISLVSVRQFKWLANAGQYDQIFYCMGNSPFHRYIYELLKERPGTVWLHDPSLVGFYRWYFQEKGQPLYPTPDELFPWARRYGAHATDLLTLGLDALNDEGIFLAGEVASYATKVIANSHFAKELIELECEGKVPVLAIPTGEHPLPPPTMPWRDLAAKYGLKEDSQPIISAGFVAPMKWPDLIIDVFASLVSVVDDAVLAFVGDCPPELEQTIAEKKSAYGLDKRVLVTGYVTEEEFNSWLSAARCAVELRYPATGGSSGAVMRCLAAGVPTVVSANGPYQELPDSAVVKLPVPPEAARLAGEIARILQDDGISSRLRTNARQYAEAIGLDSVADQLWALINGS